MIEIGRYHHPEDRAEVEALYRRVLAPESAAALDRRWDWVYLKNPNLPQGTPLIWLVREDARIVGQFATIPVRLSVRGTEIDAAWGTDVMVAPECRGRGLGEALFNAWNAGTGAAIGLGLTDASAALFVKLHWPYIGKVGRFVYAISEHAAASWRGTRPSGLGEAKVQLRRLTSRLLPADNRIQRVTQFDKRFTELWERVAPKFDFAVRRDAGYLNWKYVGRPHLEYKIAALKSGETTAGYVVYRHVQEPQWRVTVLVDFLADPTDAATMPILLDWIRREAIDANSDLVRVFATHAAFQAAFRSAGFLEREATLRFVAKITGHEVPATFYASTSEWHVTRGDSDCDR